MKKLIFFVTAVVSGLISSLPSYGQKTFFGKWKEKDKTTENCVEQRNTIQTGYKHLSPLPGKVTRILVKVGDQVTHGTHCLDIEALKMTNGIGAVRGGMVTRIYVNVGDQVQEGTPLFETTY